VRFFSLFKRNSLTIYLIDNVEVLDAQGNILTISAKQFFNSIPITHHHRIHIHDTKLSYDIN
jgi:hypothetical protein